MAETDAPTNHAAQGKAEIDNFELTGAGTHEGKTLALSVSAELMPNQSLNAPLAPSSTIRVVQDTEGLPLIFSMNAGGLHVIHHDATVTGGWKPVDVLAGFEGYVETAAMDVAQANDGKISVTLALSKSKGGETDIFTAWELPDDEGYDWAKLSDVADRARGLPDGFRADAVIMSAGDLGDPLCAVSGGTKGAETRYTVSGGGKPASPFEYPENVDPKTLIQMTAGVAFGEPAFFYLHRQGGSQSLGASPVSNDSYYDYSPGYKDIPSSWIYTAIATPVVVSDDPELTTSDLFAATSDGIHVFTNTLRHERQVVTTALKNVHELTVRHHGKDVVVWALVPPNNLYFIRGIRKSDSYQWEEPTLFQEGITHLGALRNKKRNTNEVFAISDQGEIHHTWQDPKTTLWRKSKIRVRDDAKVVDQPTYTTQINLTDKSGAILPGTKIRLSASEWTYATVNGKLMMLDDQSEAAVEPDATGNLTVMIASDDLSVPILHAQSDHFEGTVNIWPNGKIRKGLRQIQNADSVQGAYTQKGEQVFDTSQSTDVLNAVAAKVSLINGAKVKDHPENQGRVFATITPGDRKATDELDPGDASATGAFAMELSGSTWRPVDPAPLIAASLGIDGLKDLAGDFLHDLRTAFDSGVQAVEGELVELSQGASFAIHWAEDEGKKVLSFVLKVADKAVKIALDTLGKVMKVLTWLLEKIGATLLKILEWLGFTFLWDEIWKTHILMAELVRNVVGWADDKLHAELDRLDDFITGQLDELEKKLDALTLAPEVAGKSTGTLMTGASGVPNISAKAPQLNYATYHLMHSLDHGSGGGDGSSGGKGEGSESGDPLIELLNDVIVPAFDAFWKAAAADLETFKQFVSPGGATLENLLNLSRNLIKTILEPLKKLISGLLCFIGEIADSLKALLDDPLGFPFLEGLYNFVTGLFNDGQGEKLTVLNLTTLIIAVPATSLLLIETGNSPADHAPSGGLSRATIDQVLGPAGRSPAPLRPTAQPEIAVVEAPAPVFARDTLQEAALYINTIGGMMAGITGLSVAAMQGTAALTDLKKITEEKGSSGDGVPPEKQRLIPRDDKQDPVFKVLRTNNMTRLVLILDMARFVGTVPLPSSKEPGWVYDMQLGGYLTSILAELVVDMVGFIATFSGSKNPTPEIIVNSFMLAAGDLITGSVSLAVDTVSIVEEDGKVILGLTLASNVLSNFGGVAQGVGSFASELTKQGSAPAIVADFVAVGGIGSRLLGAVVAVTTAITLAVELARDDASQLAHLRNPGG